MPEIETRDVLGAYTWGTLTPAQERAFHKAAQDDQEFFNISTDDDLEREALSSKSFRREIKHRVNRKGPIFI